MQVISFCDLSEETTDLGTLPAPPPRWADAARMVRQTIAAGGSGAAAARATGLRDHDLLTDDERSEWLSKLDGVSLISDGFIPFRDNIDHAQRHGVRFIAQPGGSTRDAEVEEACREYGITLVHTKLRPFHH